MRKKQLYFDGAADAPIMKESFKAMKPFLTRGWVGNAHSIHAHGIKASMALDEAKNDILASLGFTQDAASCVLTSGASEGNNMVVHSCCYTTRCSRMPRHSVIMVGMTEHESLIVPIQCYKGKSLLCYLKPDSETGAINRQSVLDSIADLDKKYDDGRYVVWLLALSPVNNETGVANDVEGIVEELNHRHVPIVYRMLDCTQSLSCGSCEMDLAHGFPNYDYFVIGGHKIGGPEGIGAVIARKSRFLAHVETHDLMPLIYGGSQESGLRAGTSNVCGAVGMAVALKELKNKDLYGRFYSMHDALVSGLRKIDPGLKINGQGRPNIVSVTFSVSFTHKLQDSDFRGDDLTQFMNMNFGISVSAGAACSAGAEGLAPLPSHVLLAMGLTPDEVARTVRFSFAWDTKPREVSECLRRIERYKRSSI